LPGQGESVCRHFSIQLLLILALAFDSREKVGFSMEKNAVRSRKIDAVPDPQL
jgi:hypothetical protein